MFFLKRFIRLIVLFAKRVVVSFNLRNFPSPTLFTCCLFQECTESDVEVTTTLDREVQTLQVEVTEPKK